MANSPIRSHFDIIRLREQQLADLTQRGEVSPLLLQHVIGFPLLLILPLVIPLRSHGISLLVRFVFFSFILSAAIYVLLRIRTLSMAMGCGLGIVTSWLTVWAAALLIFNDPQKNFERIERKIIIFPDVKGASRENGSTRPTGAKTSQTDGLAARLQPRDRCAQHSVAIAEQKGECLGQEVLKWQPYPNSFAHRLDWALDLVFNFRGPAWNWRIPNLPPLPKVVVDCLRDRTSELETPDAFSVQNSRSCLGGALRTMAVSYIALDIGKVVMNRDPYFWGVTTITSPPPAPFDYLVSLPLLVRVHRLLLAGYGIFTAIHFVTSFCPVIFLGLSLCFPRLSRAISGQPLDAAWLYPRYFGPFTSVLDYGLPGCWSRWWHQLFFFGFMQPADFIYTLFPENLKQRKNVCRAVRTLVVFSFSGLVHACGSYTQFGPTRPINVFLFFFVQAPGIMTQRFLVRNVIPRLLPFRIPLWLRRTANLAFVIAWFTLTGPLIVDDYSKGGLWLLEPVPFSVLRALGFDLEGGGWFCWHKPWFRWWRSDTWWQTGVQML
jgi:hypothetical protein